MEPSLLEHYSSFLIQKRHLDIGALTDTLLKSRLLISYIIRITYSAKHSVLHKVRAP